jgi:hypothetical protein
MSPWVARGRGAGTATKRDRPRSAEDSSWPKTLAKERIAVIKQLNEKQRDRFYKLLDAYQYHAEIITGKRYASWRVLAELAKDGWSPPRPWRGYFSLRQD